MGTPGFGATSLWVEFASICTDCMLADLEHVVMHPRLAGCIVTIQLADSVDGEVVVRLHTERHICKRLSAAWDHGVPKHERCLVGYCSEGTFQGVDHVAIVVEERAVNGVTMVRWVSFCFSVEFLPQTCLFTEPVGHGS